MNKDRVLMAISYDPDKANLEAIASLNELYAQGLPVIGLFADLPTAEQGVAFPVYVCDGIALKTIVRANPGLVELAKGTIVAKWHYNDFPSFQELSAQ